MITLLSRKEREKLNRRQAMLDAALVVFAEKGYASATLEEIAHRAEFGKGTLYLYFPKGKEEILRALIEQMFEVEYQETNKMFSEAKAAGMSFFEILHQYIQGLVMYLNEHKDVFRMMVKEVNRMMASDDMAQVAFVMHHRERIVGLFMPYIHEAIGQGEIGGFIQPHLLANMILGNVHGYMMYSTFMQHHQESCDRAMFHAPVLSPEESADILTEMLMKGIGKNK